MKYTLLLMSKPNFRIYCNNPNALSLSKGKYDISWQEVLTKCLFKLVSNINDKKVICNGLLL